MKKHQSLIRQFNPTVQQLSRLQRRALDLQRAKVEVLNRTTTLIKDQHITPRPTIIPVFTTPISIASSVLDLGRLFVAGAQYNPVLDSWELFNNADDDLLGFDSYATGGNGLQVYTTTDEEFNLYNKIMWVRRDQGAWSLKNLPDEAFDICCSADGTVIFAICDDTIYKSIDDGSTWQAVYTIPPNPYGFNTWWATLRVNNDGSKIYLGIVYWKFSSTQPDGAGEFWAAISSNGGTTWSTLHIEELHRSNDLVGGDSAVWLNNGRLIVKTVIATSGGDPFNGYVQVVVSDNNGLNWTLVHSSGPHYGGSSGASSFAGVSNDQSRIVISSLTIGGHNSIESLDGGDTWSFVLNPFSGGEIAQSFIIASNILYIRGSNGSFIKDHPVPYTSLENVPLVDTNRLSLY